MSFPDYSFSCSFCDFQTKLPSLPSSYVYVLSDNIQLPVKCSHGWCLNCSSVKWMIEGISIDQIETDISNLKQEFNKLNGKLFKNISEKSRISELINSFSKQELIVEILSGKTSLSFCESCKLPVIFRLNNDPSTNVHLNCGGNLISQFTEIRFMRHPEKKLIKPLFSIS